MWMEKAGNGPGVVVCTCNATIWEVEAEWMEVQTFLSYVASEFYAKWAGSEKCRCTSVDLFLLSCGSCPVPCWLPLPRKVSSDLRTFSLQPLTFHLLNWYTDFTVYVNKANRDLKSLEHGMLTSRQVESDCLSIHSVLVLDIDKCLLH